VRICFRKHRFLSQQMRAICRNDLWRATRHAANEQCALSGGRTARCGRDNVAMNPTQHDLCQMASPHPPKVASCGAKYYVMAARWTVVIQTRLCLRGCLLLVDRPKASTQFHRIF